MIGTHSHFSRGSELHGISYITLNLFEIISTVEALFILQSDHSGGKKNENFPLVSNDGVETRGILRHLGEFRFSKFFIIKSGLVR